MHICMRRVDKTKVNIIAFLLLFKSCCRRCRYHCSLLWVELFKETLIFHRAFSVWNHCRVQFNLASCWLWLRLKSGLVVYFNHSSFLKINQTLGNNFEHIFHSKHKCTHTHTHAETPYIHTASNWVMWWIGTNFMPFSFIRLQVRAMSSKNAWKTSTKLSFRTNGARGHLTCASWTFLIKIAEENVEIWMQKEM